jgi:hypothetical protein
MINGQKTSHAAVPLRGEFQDFLSPMVNLSLKDNLDDHLPIDMTSRLLSSLC